MKNAEIAKKLYEIADFLEATKDRFRARAYRKAANVISNLEIEITNLQSNHFDLQELPYIGINIANTIKKILKNETIDLLNLVMAKKFISAKVQKPPFCLHNAKKIKLIVMRILKQIRGINEIYPVGELRRYNEFINNLEFLALINKSFSWKNVKNNKYVSHLEKIKRNKAVLIILTMGYEYLAITDHSQSLKITKGLDKKRLFKQIEAIDKINAKLKNLTVLKSSECDILEDGSLDFPKDVLKELDLVVCSVHSKFRISKEKQTDRIIRAIENPYCTILGHLTGRLIMSRLPYEIDIDKILMVAKANGCILELNCQPYRLDIKDEYCIQAKNLGIKIAISSDAHSLRGFQFIELGISQARRAGLEAKDVINTYGLQAMRKLLRKT